MFCRRGGEGVERDAEIWAGEEEKSENKKESSHQNVLFILLK